MQTAERHDLGIRRTHGHMVGSSLSNTKYPKSRRFPCKVEGMMKEGQMLRGIMEGTDGTSSDGPLHSCLPRPPCKSVFSVLHRFFLRLPGRIVDNLPSARRLATSRCLDCTTSFRCWIGWKVPSSINRCGGDHDNAVRSVPSTFFHADTDQFSCAQLATCINAQTCSP